VADLAGKEGARGTDDDVAQDVLAPYVRRATLADGRSLIRERRVLPDGTTVDTLRNPADGAGVDMDFETLQQAARARVFEERGAMRPELFERVLRAAPEERLEVLGWLAYDAEPEVRDPHRRTEAAAVAERNRLRIELRQDELRTLAERTAGIATLEFVGATPYVRLRATAGAVESLSRSGMLQVAELDPGPGRPLTTVWKQAVGADVADAAGWDGTGVRVAVLEGGQPDNYAGLGVIAVASPTGFADGHARRVTGMVRQGVFPFGNADSASLLTANWDNYMGPPATLDLWAIAPAQAAEVINFSWSFSSGADGGLNVTDLYHDYITLIGPFTPYTLAAGNGGNDPNPALQFTHNRSYNGLVVGASNDGGTPARGNDTIAAFSSWRNHGTPSGDRELPEVVAPGQNVTVTGDASSGTSLAAPVVAGTIACMIERNTNLAGWPEAIKAIVMATSDCNVSGVLLNLTDSTDDRDGMGEVNAARAVTLSNPANYRSPGASAATGGHAYGYMNFTSNFTGNVFQSTWNVRTDGGGRLHLVFTWDATTSCTDPNVPSTCTGGGPDADLNLYLYRASDNALVATSTSFDNNYEVFAGRMLTPNTNYRLEIRKASTRTAGTHYALAWAPFAPACPNP
jgi:hypothetical protein